MIHILDKNNENKYYFPKNINEISEKYKLSIINKTDNKVIDFEVNDLFEMINYYTFSLIFEDFQDGEYEYTLFNDNNSIVGKGMILIGEYRENKETKIYNPEINYNIYNATE